MTTRAFIGGARTRSHDNGRVLALPAGVDVDLAQSCRARLEAYLQRRVGELETGPVEQGVDFEWARSNLHTQRFVISAVKLHPAKHSRCCPRGATGEVYRLLCSKERQLPTGACTEMRK